MLCLGKKTWRKMLFRLFLFCSALFLWIVDVNLIDKFLNIKIIMGISVYHLFWLYLLLEMLPVLFSRMNQESYCGKHLQKHFRLVENYKPELLEKAIQKNSQGAKRSFLFWIGLNAFLFLLYFLLDLNEGYVYLLFLFYYLADMVCVNLWCPFHSIILKNKCCNECRIYNWGHWMYFTPFILVPNFWTWSLLLVSIIIFIQWEYQYYKYPERFSSVSNRSLQCSFCQHQCRYKKKKRKRRFSK